MNYNEARPEATVVQLFRLAVDRSQTKFALLNF